MSSLNLLFAPSNSGTQFGISPIRTFRIGGSYEHWMRADELREAAVNVRFTPESSRSPDKLLNDRL